MCMFCRPDKALAPHPAFHNKHLSAFASAAKRFLCFNAHKPPMRYSPQPIVRATPLKGTPGDSCLTITAISPVSIILRMLNQFCDAVASKSVRSSACCSNLARRLYASSCWLLRAAFQKQKNHSPENRKMPQYWLFIQYFRFSMALTAALKAQIAAWYKALQDRSPTLFPVRRSGR